MATSVFVLLAFLGAAVAVRDNDHFVVDVFPQKVKTWKFNLVLNILSLLIQLAVACIMVRYGITFTKSMSLRISYSLGIPLSYIACVLPVAGTFMVLGSIERLLNIVEISKRQEEER